MESMETPRVAAWLYASLALLSLGCVEKVELGGGALGGPEPAPAGPDAGAPDVPAVPPDAGPAAECQTPPTLAGANVEVAADFDGLYQVYDLGIPAGVPNPLGGVTVKFGDPNTLLIAGGSESEDGELYEVGVSRGPCGHIVGFDGAARQVATTPYVDATLSYVPGRDLLLYAEWPEYTISQLRFGASSPAVRTDLTTLGLPTDGDQGPGGLGFVPPGIGDRTGELRMVTWPAGAWYQVDLEADEDLFRVTELTRITTLANNPGGFAYVPEGSPGFARGGIIVSEWNEDDATRDRVAVYDVNTNGDPLPETRRELLSRFPRPWGAYFEPATGDFLFLSWGTGEDRVYVIQGFAPPPPIE